MKKIIFTLLLSVFFINFVYAGAFWIIDIDNNIIAKCQYIPSQVDLESRNEVAIYMEEDITFEEAEYRGNKIVRHVKTADEIQDEVDKEEKISEEEIVADRIRNNAIDELEAEGISFKHIKKK